LQILATHKHLEWISGSSSLSKAIENRAVAVVNECGTSVIIDIIKQQSYQLDDVTVTNFAYQTRCRLADKDRRSSSHAKIDPEISFLFPIMPDDFVPECLPTADCFQLNIFNVM